MNKTICRMNVLLMVLCLAAVSVQAMPSYNDVLLVVNSQSAESQEIGAYFKAARNIPDANICNISVTPVLGTGGRMGNAEKWTALNTIKKHMLINGLTDKINYIVLTHGIPKYAYTGKFDPYLTAKVEMYHLFDVFLMYQLSESITDSTIANIFVNNKYFYYNTDNINRKFSRNKFGYYIVGRLDGLGTTTIKSMIDNTGAAAYESYKKQANGKMKLLTLTPYYSQAVADEINKRGNLEIVSPNPVPPDVWNSDTQTTKLVDNTDSTITLATTFDKVGKDAMFCFLNDVAWDSFFAWPQGNSYYADADFVGDYPFIYRGATFLPGSIMMIYRSNPACYDSHGSSGGVFKMNMTTKAITSWVKFDATDMKFRHQTCVEYDPVNNQLWCGTGNNQLDVFLTFDKRCTDDAHRETMRNYGGGIAIYDAATGSILDKKGKLNYINANDKDSPLKNNRVTKLVYDKNSKYMWVAHYKGIQYYDLTAKTWNDIPELQNDYAAAAGIYLDPFDSDKVYFSFYYNGDYDSTQKVSSLISGADTGIFEYSKSAKTVTLYVIDATRNKGLSPQMGKTSANTIWVSKGNVLYRYDLAAKTVVEQIDMNTVIPDKLTPPANSSSVSIDPIRNVTSVPLAKVAIATVGVNINYTKDLIEGTPSNCQKKNYIVRVVEKSVPPSEIQCINTDKMNAVGTGAIPGFKVRDVVSDPSTSGKSIYMVLSTIFGAPVIMRSTDGAGASWSAFSTDASLAAVNGITLDGKGSIYAARGYLLGQNIAADFQAFGLCAWGGGMVHDTMEYDSNYTGAPVPYPPYSPGYPYYTNSGSWNGNGPGIRGSSQMEHMMFMLLDGFYMGEARLAVFRNYPQTGGGGHEGHMTVFEPKCAPFVPRVNEPLIPANPQVLDKSRIEIPILSPGLPWHMNDLIPETLNKDTIQITDETGAVFTPSKYEFIKPAGPDPADKDGKKFITGTGKLVISGNYTGIVYKVKLLCGINGIKNIKGASLTNTRSNEFKDDITLNFGNGVDISKGVYVPPVEIIGPVKMPQSNSKVDLVVSSISLSPVPPVAGKPLTVKFQIKNIGTAKTSAGTITAGVYWNNILIGSVTHGDLAAGASSAVLSVNLDAQYVTVGNKNTVMAVADSTNIVAEMRETNNTASTTFFIDNRPDLIVKTITLSSTKPGKTTVNFNIANTGFGPTTAGTGAQVAEVYVNNVSKGTVSYNDLAKGAAVSLQLNNVTVTAGTCKVKVVADSTGKVTEVSKTNNILEKLFSIK